MFLPDCTVPVLATRNLQKVGRLDVAMKNADNYFSYELQG